MRNLKENLIFLFSLTQFVFPILGLIYIVGWFVSIINQDWFTPIDKIFGLVPSIIDAIYSQNVLISGQEVTMGYVYSSAICIIFALLSTKMIEFIIETAKKFEYLQQSKDYRKDVDEKTKERIERNKKVRLIQKIYSLVELKLNLIDIGSKTDEELSKLKNELSKLLINKIQEKYTDIKFKVQNKIFIINEDFSNIDSFINDIVIVYKVLADLIKNQGVELDILFSSYANWETIDENKAFAILDNINKLGNKNKVVVTTEIKEKYEMSKEIHFAFIPLGYSKFFLGKKFSNEDVDIELFYLKSFKN